MNNQNLEPLRVCCKNDKEYLIVYDGGPTLDLAVLVCKSCFENFPTFQKFVRSKQSVKDISEKELKKLLNESVKIK